MPQIDIDGANSKISADTIRGQSGTTVTVQSGHNLAGSGSGLTALNASNLTGTVANANLASGIDASKLTTGTLPMARLSGTLPSLNGSALTNLPSPNLAPKFYVYDENADISLTSSTWTKVSFPDTLFNDDTVFASDKFTVPSGQAGKYVLSARVSVHSASNNITDARIKIYKNGSFYHGGYLFAYGSSIRHIAPHLDFIEDAAVADYYEIYIFVNATSPKIFADSENKKFQFFSGYKIG